MEVLEHNTCLILAKSIPYITTESALLAILGRRGPLRPFLLYSINNTILLE